LELLTKANGSIQRSAEDKEVMIGNATVAYANFLTALGFDWKADPHSANTPYRVAKAWVNDLISGSVNDLSDITSFPNDAGYTGIICQTRIPVVSMCAHHNLAFIGVAHVAYLPGRKPEDKIVGLSKLNRIVDWYSRRPNIQESLTKQIHDKINELCVGNRGVAVLIESQHNCVRCRGVGHESVMKTNEVSGYFHTNEVGTRSEFFNLIDQSRTK
jgi:GTP cyclohydrolase I